MSQSIDPDTSGTTLINVDHFVLDTRDKLKATMNRYRLDLGVGVPQRHPHDRGYILLFAHGIGFHKEHWEPVIECLFKDDRTNRSATRILEAWAIDFQNHGEAAALNDEVLKRKPKVFTLQHYAEAFVNLCRSGLLGEIRKGVQKVVLIGHSAGAVGLIQAAAHFSSPRTTPFDKIILVDPPLFPSSMVNNMTERFRLVEKSIPSRRSTWESREAAYQWLKTRPPYKFWDPRILKLYTEHGLRPVPTSLLDPNQKGVELSCSPTQEVGIFTALSNVFEAFESLNDICKALPVHLVFGSRCDLFSREQQDAICDPSTGRSVASVTRIRGSGHLVVQEQPDKVANVIYSILNTRQIGGSKL